MISQDDALILIWPGGLEQGTLLRGTVLRLNRVYVESKAEWYEATERLGRWMGRQVPK